MLRPDDACQKRFSWFLDWIPKLQKCVNLVGLVKRFRTSNLLAKLGFDKERASQSFPTVRNNWNTIQ